MDPNAKVVCNGIDAVTGQFLFAPRRISDVAAFLRKQGPQDSPSLTALLHRAWRTLGLPCLGLPLDVDPVQVEKAGWAVVFHHTVPAAVRDALRPLIEHRRRQVAGLLQELEHHPGEHRGAWLARHGVGAGSVEPSKVPFYILLVGSPEDIPFSFCHELDVEYAVGWLHFDIADEYARYAESVVRYETQTAASNAREAAFFATRHAFDEATQLSADQLVDPLAGGRPNSGMAAPGVAERWGFRTRRVCGAAASRSALGSLLVPARGALTPAFLFTATHGMGFPCGHPRQGAAQGALLCQDWPGFGIIEPAHYFSAADLPAEACVHGLIAFLFACYGGGTPERDRFLHDPGGQPAKIADRPFLAALPKALLAHAGGGALAVIAHVERAWGYSIVTPQAGPQLLPFENAVGRILLGQPVGYAMKDFNERYATLSTSLANLLEQVSFGAQVPDLDLVTAWTERNDAEGYVVLGDPAVRLRPETLS